MPKRKANRKPAVERTVFAVKLSRDERALIREAAGDFPMSTWCRVKLLEAARRETAEKGGKR